MRLLRSRGAKAVAGLIGVPVVGVAGAAGYITYRINTKPAEHTFPKIIADDGSLMIEDCVIPMPTRWHLIKRVLTLLRLFIPVFIRYLFVKDEEAHVQWLVTLLAAVQRAGPAFVKAGQWACTRNDIFSPAFRRVFTQLYCEVDIHPFTETQRTIEEDLGQPLAEVFQRIEQVPVGSGSIGQVHDATLHDGRHVVVKVMHPHVVQTIAHDFLLINAVARFFDEWPSLREWQLRNTAYAWTNHLAAQLDFRFEADNLRLFREHFRGTDYVDFPEPIRSTQRVLIESFAPGEPATEEVLKSFDSHARDIIASKGLNCYCKMLLRDNFIHGDMHPGNILVDGRDPHHPRVTMIDVGLCQKLTHAQGRMSNNLMSSFVHWKEELCAESLLGMGTDQSRSDRERFHREIAETFTRFRPLTGGEEGCIENVLQDLFECVRRSRVTMDPAYSSLMWSVLVLEGFIMALNPEYDMVKHAGPWLVTEGHLSKGLIRNVVTSTLHGWGLRAREMKSRMLGSAEEPYEPKRRPRFQVRED